MPFSSVSVPGFRGGLSWKANSLPCASQKVDLVCRTSHVGGDIKDSNKSRRSAKIWSCHREIQPDQLVKL